ncbi:MAG: hypothetical protein AAF657_20305 [Acidobacteriota bacterium]
MPLRPISVVTALTALYFLPGLLFFYVAEGSDCDGEQCSKATLIEAGEPGESLIVTGTVFGPDGATPAAGITLYAYHTDAAGLYSETNDNTDPRIKATLRTDTMGRYELHTIKPAPYPGGGVPAHIHYRLSGAGYTEQRFDLHFEDDPYLSRGMRERSAKLGRFGSIRPLARDSGGGWRVVRDLRLR